MTREECIKLFKAKPSTKYPSRYDVNGNVYLDGYFTKKITKLPISFGVVKDYFYCSYNQLITLEGVPIEVSKDFFCSFNKLTTLDHLPKYIGGELHCHNNPLQNLNGLKDVEIKESIRLSHRTEEQLNYWIKALYNTDLDTLEYHYDNHRYEFYSNSELERYIMNELEEIIKLKKLKIDLKSIYLDTI